MFGDGKESKHKIIRDTHNQRSGYSVKAQMNIQNTRGSEVLFGQTTLGSKPTCTTYCDMILSKLFTSRSLCFFI